MKKSTNNLKKLLSLLIIIGFFTAFTQAYAAPLTLNGYDAVAYHTQNTAIPGSSNFTVDYAGSTYQFASAENRDLFSSNPEKYAPEYGGYCAYGMAFGAKVPVDGTAFQIVDGKLYVNKNQSVYQLWKQDIPGNIKKADAQWRRLGDS